MKKINYLLLIMLLFFALGCRSDYMNEKDSGKNMGSFSYKQIGKENIPQILNAVSQKTENFKVPLKSGTNKTETVFGEIDTNYIIQSNVDGQTYYVFAVLPATVSDEAEIFNLEVKPNTDSEPTMKIVVYSPTEEWLLNGNNDFSVFSGDISTYSLDGVLESSVVYELGRSNCPPCPDCSGTTGGGGGGGPLNPPGGGGGMPTDCVGCSGGGSGGVNCWVPIMNDDTVVGAFNKCTGQVVYFYPKSTIGLRVACSDSSSGVVIASQETPCEKTEKMLERPNVATGIIEVKAQAKKAADDINEGEIGRIEKNNGTVAPADVSSDHHVTFNDISNSKGVYHNHTFRGAKIHSPGDIGVILNFAAQQSTAANYQNAYLGMVGANKCYSGAPNCYRYYHYIVRFTGTASDLSILSTFTEEKMKVLKDDYRKKEKKLSENPNYVDVLGDDLNKKGLEKLFFDTLANMNLSGKVMLQRVDDDGTINTITLDNNGNPKATPCP